MFVLREPFFYRRPDLGSGAGTPESEPMPENLRNIVLIEDSASEAALTRAYLENDFCHMHHAVTGTAGLDLIAGVRPEVVLLDINLPDMSGLDVLDRLRGAANRVPVIMVTGVCEIDSVVECMRRGAFDYIAKPFTAQRLHITLKNTLERQRLEQLVQDYRDPYEGGFHGMIGTCPAMRAVYRMIEAAAPTGAAIFITGESGTGKELVAQAIHQVSPRRERPMIALNCAALPLDLAESELFGHVRGAFTGATRDRAGAVELAQDGTLFLDEICDMPLPLQAKLLRFLQNGSYRRIGDSQVRHAEVRLISATNHDPRERITRGLFREDLFYRLHVIPIALPRLAQRGDDIITLARYLLTPLAAAADRRIIGFSAEAEAHLRVCPWPGNVREMENAIRYAVVMGKDEVISLPELAPALAPPLMPTRILPTTSAGGSAPALTLAEIEREVIETAIRAADGNIQGAARRLGIDPSTIHRKRRAWTGPRP